MTGDALYDKIIEFCLGFPEATQDMPWGHPAFKVRKKSFVFLGRTDAGAVSFSMKLPFSKDSALSREHTSPTGYGLGRHGWVSFVIDDETDQDWTELTAWIEESYRAVAPKTLARKLVF